MMATRLDGVESWKKGGKFRKIVGLYIFGEILFLRNDQADQGIFECKKKPKSNAKLIYFNFKKGYDCILQIY